MSGPASGGCLYSYGVGGIVSPSEPPTQSLSQPPAPLPVRAEGEAGAASILVVEDDRRMAAFLDRALTYAGYRTVVAADGETALTRAEETPPDLVLLDVMLPDIDGLEVARRL